MGNCLGGRHVRLREVEEADAAFILSLRLDPRLSRFLNPVPNDLERQREFIRGYRKHDGECYFIIEDRGGRPVGTIRISEITSEAFYAGSFIVMPGAGTFAALEAFLLVAHYGFEVLKRDAMRGWIAKGNRTHLRFLEKMGGVIIGETQDQFLIETDRGKIAAAEGRYRRFLKPG